MESLKSKLNRGGDLLGTMVTLVDNPELPRLFKVCGFDYFIIDCEHGCFDYRAVAAMLAMAAAVGIGGFVRIPEVKREVVLKYMEAGAGGLLLPNCNTPEQARLLVEYAKYAPLGNRGVSLFRSHTGYAPVPDAAAYMAGANRRTILMAQIESAQAVSHIDGILGVEGIDVAFIGPNDLSHSMGILGRYEDERYIAAVDRVIAAARAHGKYAGIHLMDAGELLRWKQKGMRMNLWSSDTRMMLDAARAGLGLLAGGGGQC